MLARFQTRFPKRNNLQQPKVLHGRLKVPESLIFRSSFLQPNLCL